MYCPSAVFFIKAVKDATSKCCLCGIEDIDKVDKRIFYCKLSRIMLYYWQVHIWISV